MSPSPTTVDRTDEAFAANREAMLQRLAELETVLDEVRAGGGERYVERHHRRGKLLPRERIELLLDRDSPFLDLQPFAGWDGEHGSRDCGSSVCGIGVVEGTLAMVIAHDPTVRGGATNPASMRKGLRMTEIARENRLPVINLVESAGADLPKQLDLFVPGGQIFRDLTRLSAAGIPTIALVFGSSTAGGAYIPGMCDHTVFVRGGAEVFLGGPPLVKKATGEESTAEELGGAEMHSRTSGLSDHLAEDEHDAIRIGRRIVANLRHRRLGPGPDRPSVPPRLDPEELLGIVPADLRLALDVREVIARLVDGSAYDEHKPLYGEALSTGWAHLHGHPVGILANVRGILFSEEAQKAAQFIQLAGKRGVPLLFLHNTTGFMVGRDYEQGGIIKHGALFINAVSNSTVPHLGVVIGGSYGAANYAMGGRAYAPRFLFSWPSALSAVMGPEQLAGVLSIVARGAARARGQEYDEDGDAAMQAAVKERIEAEQIALAISGRGYDDGIIDPRDTRDVLGICLAACHGAPIPDPTRPAGFGVFRT